MTQKESEDGWAGVVDGDKATFRRLTKPLLDGLRRAARHELTYLTSVGDLDRDILTPDDLVAEILARAWRDRRRRPESLDLKAWLHALLFRVMDAIVAKQKMLRSKEAVSLEDPVPDQPLYDDDESFYEWYQPDELTRWEDVIPVDEPSPETIVAAIEQQRGGLSDLSRRVLALHDAQGIALPQVAAALRLSVIETRRLLFAARQAIKVSGRSRQDK